MFKRFEVSRMDHYARHLALTSLVVFLFVFNFSMFNYASAASGSEVDTRVHQGLQTVSSTYQRSSQYMYDYSVTWGELLLGWNGFIVDTYYQLNE